MLLDDPHVRCRRELLLDARVHEVRGDDEGNGRRSAHRELHARALQAARDAVLAMRSSEEIGDDAFHQIEEELDWLDMADSRKEG